MNGVCRLQKYKGGSPAAGLQIHDDREKESHTNPDIDRERTKDNYRLKECPDYNQAIEARIKEAYTGKKAIRKDAVKMVGVMLSASHEFFAGRSSEETKKYFADCYEWAVSRWGEKNVISATVHMDEKTPHMHLYFVPIIDGRLSAKAVIGERKGLQQLQDDFFESVSKKHGLERGEKASLDDKDAPKPRKHMKTAEYKERQLAGIANEVKLEKEKAVAEIVEFKKTASQRKEELGREAAEIEPELKILRKTKADLGKISKIEKIEPKVPLVGETHYRLSPTEFETLVNQAKMGAAMKRERQRLNALKSDLKAVSDDLAKREQSLIAREQKLAFPEKALENREMELMERHYKQEQALKREFSSQTAEVQAENKNLKDINRHLTYKVSRLEGWIRKLGERFPIVKEITGKILKDFDRNPFPPEKSKNISI